MKVALDSATKSTHEVLNQAPPLVDYNLFTTDRVLGESLDREGAAWARPLLKNLDGSPDPSRLSSGDFKPTRIRRSCTRTIALGGASTKSSFIPPGTN